MDLEQVEFANTAILLFLLSVSVHLTSLMARWNLSEGWLNFHSMQACRPPPGVKIQEFPLRPIFQQRLNCLIESIMQKSTRCASQNTRCVSQYGDDSQRPYRPTALGCLYISKITSSAWSLVTRVLLGLASFNQPLDPTEAISLVLLGGWSDHSSTDCKALIIANCSEYYTSLGIDKA